MLQAVYVAYRKTISFLEPLCNRRHLRRDTLVGLHLVLQPVAFLYIAERGDKVIVIRIIIDAVERSQILEAFHKHSLLSEGIVIERSVYLIHSLSLRPFFRSAEQQPCDLDVVDCIKPSEAGPLCPVPLIVPRVDHAAYPSHHFLPVHRKPHHPSAIFQGSHLCQ